MEYKIFIANHLELLVGL